jgi:hypothetical protein
MSLIICTYCKKDFEVPIRREKKAKFCSRKCWAIFYATKPKSLKAKKNYSLSKKNELNPNWKGNGVGYEALHAWVHRRLKKPGVCENCHVNKPYDLANRSGKYLRDLSDWEWLCRRCHMLGDGRMKNLKQFANPS